MLTIPYIFMCDYNRYDTRKDKKIKHNDKTFVFNIKEETRIMKVS